MQQNQFQCILTASLQPNISVLCVNEAIFESKELARLGKVMPPAPALELPVVSVHKKASKSDFNKTRKRTRRLIYSRAPALSAAAAGGGEGTGEGTGDDVEWLDATEDDEEDDGRRLLIWCAMATASAEERPLPPPLAPAAARKFMAAAADGGETTTDSGVGLGRSCLGLEEGGPEIWPATSAACVSSGWCHDFLFWFSSSLPSQLSLASPEGASWMSPSTSAASSPSSFMPNSMIRSLSCCSLELSRFSMENGVTFRLEDKTAAAATAVTVVDGLCDESSGIAAANPVGLRGDWGMKDSTGESAETGEVIELASVSDLQFDFQSQVAVHVNKEMLISCLLSSPTTSISSSILKASNCMLPFPPDF